MSAQLPFSGLSHTQKLSKSRPGSRIMPKKCSTNIKKMLKSVHLPEKESILQHDWLKTQIVQCEIKQRLLVYDLHD